MTEGFLVLRHILVISIHIPRGGDDLRAKPGILPHRKFQSTSPVGGMTLAAALGLLKDEISIHIPRGGDD